jgi:hypothetical protein
MVSALRTELARAGNAGGLLLQPAPGYWCVVATTTNKATLGPAWSGPERSVRIAPEAWVVEHANDTMPPVVMHPKGGEVSRHALVPEEALAPPRTEFLIPAESLAGLEKRLEALSRRAVRLKQPPITVERVGDPFVTEVVRHREMELAQGKTVVSDRVVVRVQRVRIVGVSPQLRGYRVAAVVEPLASGRNLVMVLPGNSVSSRFQHSGAFCEHCRTTHDLRSSKSRLYRWPTDAWRSLASGWEKLPTLLIAAIFPTLRSR